MGHAKASKPYTHGKLEAGCPIIGMGQPSCKFFDIVVALVACNTASSKRFGKPLDTSWDKVIWCRKGKTDSNSLARLPCPVVMITLIDSMVSLHAHAAFHSITSSRNESNSF